MFELFKRPDLRNKLTYLKSREKLKAHDEIWEKICKHLKLMFIPSKRRIPHKRVYKKRKKKKS